MVKVDTVTLHGGRAVPLAFDVAALIELEEKYGSMDGAMDAINAPQHSAQARLDFVMIIARCGEKHAPTGTPVEDAWLMQHTAPHELAALLREAIRNAGKNLTGNDAPEKKRTVDVTLEELERKNAPGS